ncbi:MAG: hypothetical protein JSU72_18780 [Deltaproteobacteria bacterium]|nr:MAG: hypothetical protein JSU72_18780 [Deltaproteobacteria bacterium]
MTKKELREGLLELDHLYTEHAKNQLEESLESKNKLRLRLKDLFLALKPQIKKETRLPWYEPTYNYAMTGNLDYIEAVRSDLAQMMAKYADSESHEA